MNDMTEEQYDEHIRRLAKFMFTLARQQSAAPETMRDDLEKLWQSLGKAFMALRRERVEKYGYEPDDDQ
jgi:hypothetical protein